MNSRDIKFLIIILFIFIFGFLALPSFNFNIASRDIKFTKINLASILDNTTTLFTLEKSSGISSSKEYTAEITFPKDNKLSIDQKRQNLIDTYNIIKKRINYSYLYDVKINSYISNDKYFIVVTFPNYYSESDLLASTLISKGEINFFSQTDKSIIPINLKDSDIDGQVITTYENQLITNQSSSSSSNLLTKDVLQFKFKEDKASDLSQALSNSKKYFLMVIDSGSFAVISTGSTIITQVEAVPSVPIKDKRQVLPYLNIVRSYFVDKPIENSLSLTSATGEVKNPEYNYENFRLILITFIISLLALILGALIFHRRNGLVKFSLMIISYLTFSIFLLKLPSTTLSIYSMIGFIFVYVITSFLAWNLLNTDPEKLNKSLIKYRDLVIFLLVILISWYKINPETSLKTDFIKVSIICLISLFLMCIFNFKIINTIDLKKVFFKNIKDE